MSRFLVTGGCGFIGSHLCAALLDAGHAVRVLDDLSTGARSNLAPGAEFLHGDVADPAVAQTAMADMDGCFHLAAIASVERGVTEWLSTHRVNLTGSIAVFDAAARTRRALPVVYASSAAVYGDNPVLPLTEAAVPRPLSAYGADKLGCEQHARVAGAVHGVPSFGLRFFNVFGPRQDPGSPYSGVISIFCDRLSAGQGIAIFGDGGQTRDFIFVADVVIALLAAMRRASVDAPVLNVCSGIPTAVSILAQSIARLCGTPLSIETRPARRGEIRHSLGSRVQATTALDLPAPAPLEDGLDKVIAWLRSGRPGLSPRPRPQPLMPLAITPEAG